MPTLITRGAMSAFGFGFGGPVIVPVPYAFTGNTVSGNGVSISVTIPAAGIPARSGIYVFVYEDPYSNAAISNGSVSDTAGTPNTYTEIGVGYEDPVGGRTQIFQAYNSNALGSGNTITYTMYVTGNYAVMSVFYVTGLRTSSSPLDAATLTTQTFGYANPAALQSGVPSVSGELFISMAGWQNDNGSTSVFSLDTSNGWVAPPPTGISGVDPTPTHFGIAGGAQVNAGVSTLTTAPTFTSHTGLFGITAIFGLKHAP